MRKFKHRKTGHVATKKDGEGYYTYTKFPDSPGGHVIDSEIIENGSDWQEILKDVPKGKFKNNVSYAGSPEQLEEYADRLHAGGMNLPSNYYGKKAIRIVSFTDGSCGYRSSNMNDYVYRKIHFQSHQMEEALKAALEPGS